MPLYWFPSRIDIVVSVDQGLLNLIAELIELREEKINSRITDITARLKGNTDALEQSVAAHTPKEQ